MQFSRDSGQSDSPVSCQFTRHQLASRNPIAVWWMSIEGNRGREKKEQSRIFDAWLQIAVTDHFPISASTANCDFLFRELFPALPVTPRSMPCLTYDMLMLYSCNKFFTHFPILILSPPVAVIVKETTVWLPSSRLHHWVQKLTSL